MNDLKFAFRQLLKNPGFTVVAVLTLALGIGANTAIFSMANSVLWRPLPFPDPDRLVAMGEGNRSKRSRGGASAGNFRDWSAQCRSFSAMAALQTLALNLSGNGIPERLVGGQVTEGFFAVLGVQPVAGRSFTRADYEAADKRLSLLSHRLWKRRFGSRADIVGQMIKLDGETHTIVGVHLDWRVLGFAVAISLISGVLFGLVPAIESSKVNLSSGLQAGGRDLTGGHRAKRLSQIFVATQVAVCFAAVIFTAMCFNSLSRFVRIPPGFDSKNLVTFGITLAGPDFVQEERRISILEQIVERVQALPGVRSACSADTLPFCNPRLSRMLQTCGPNAMLALRTHQDSGALIGALRKIVSELNPDLPLFAVKTMEECRGYRVEWKCRFTLRGP